MQKASNTLTLAVVMCGIFLLLTAPAFAQDTSTDRLCYGWHSINPDDPTAVTGRISNDQVAHNWRFAGTTGTRVIIRLEVTDGDLDPFVYITQPGSSERWIASSSNDPLGRKIVNISEVLSITGNYVLTVTRLGEEMGSSQGSYQLSLEIGPANTIVGAVTFQETYCTYRSTYDNHCVTFAERPTAMSSQFAGSIYDGEVVTGSTPSRYYDSWFFSGIADQSITAVLTLADGVAVPSGGFDLWAYSTDNESWSLLTSASGTEARIANYRLPQNGEYAFVIGDDEAFNNYQLVFSGAGGRRPNPPSCEPVVTPCPAQSPIGTAAIDLQDEVPLSGQISAAVPMIPYQFVALEGDDVTLTMERTEGDLDTYIALLDVSGNTLERDISTDPAVSTIGGFPVPSDGCYYVLAARQDGPAGTTEGTFRIVANLPSGPVETPPECPETCACGGDIAAPASVSGTIGDAYCTVYRLRGDGETYNASALRITGNLAPALALMDAEYDVMASTTANAFGTASNPLTIVTENGSYYFVIVQREGGENGTTSGDFELTLSR